MPSPLPPLPASRLVRRRPSRRWIVVVPVVLLGHLAAGAWLTLHRTRAAPPAAPTLVEIALLTPTRIAQGGADGSGDAHRAPVAAPRPARHTPDGAFQGLSHTAAPIAAPRPPAPAKPRETAAQTASQRAAAARADSGTPDGNHPDGIGDTGDANASASAASDAAAPATAADTATASTPAATAAASASATASAASAAAASAPATADATPATPGVGPTASAPGAAAPDAGAGGRADADTTATAGAATPASRAGGGPATGASQGTRFALPPSSDLRYDTFFNGAQNQSGTIHWRTDGRQYELVISLPLPFVGTYSYTSTGHVDAFGLAPDVYTETRGRRGSDVSRFDRTPPAPHVAFTRTPNTVALPDGAQDRFSMIFQLASLVRGEPRRYRPGVTREFFVVDNDSGETWPIQTTGPDAVALADGTIDAVRFTRLPRHAGDRRRIDVWLAPSLGWLPVRIMQTEPSGTQIELVYHGGARIVAAHPSLPTEGRATPGGASAVALPGVSDGAGGTGGAGPRPDRP
ncbi:MAG: DUF3108 domain-containing protein [Janthinobacterium lividum]